MRPFTSAAAALSLLIAGCRTPAPQSRGATPAPQKPAPEASSTAAAAGANRLIERAVTLPQAQIYVDTSVQPGLAEEPSTTATRNLATAEAVAVALRDELRTRGFDVRGAEAAAARDGSSAASQASALADLYRLSRQIASGTATPATARHATYLHTNAPRLLVIVSLTGSLPEPGDRRPKSPSVLAGFIADSTTGEILWSGRTSSGAAPDDPRVRQLASDLLRKLPAIPASLP